MKIEKNKFVSLTYKLRLNSADGELVEETGKDNPLEFVFGTGRMLEMFEQKLEGLNPKDDFSFELKADEAYGEVNEEAVVDLPKSLFEVNGAIDDEMLTVGNPVPMQDAHGNRMTGIVVEVNDDAVKMDFNHPLAGDNLFFSGSVLEVREATEDELADSCGGCGSDCDSDCNSGCSCGC